MSMLGRQVKYSPNTVPLSEDYEHTIGPSITYTRAKISGCPPYSAFFSIAFKLFSKELY